MKPLLLAALAALAGLAALYAAAVAAAAGRAPPRLARTTTCEDVASSMDAASAAELLALARPLAAAPFFAIFHASIDAPCPFWADDAGKCAMRECSVCNCPENEVPVLWRDADGAARAGAVGRGGGGGGEGAVFAAGSVGAPSVSAVLAAPGGLACEAAVGDGDTLNDIDRTHSDATDVAMRNWAAPSAPDDWTVQDAPDAAEMLYVDLRKNPERYTGFTGPQTHRVWSAIYDENCFALSGDRCRNGVCAPDTCKEERVFYRLISGIHTSITMHIAAAYLHGTRWGPNVDIFAARVRAFPERVENLYMTLALVLRAVAKVAPSLDPSVYSYSTGNATQDVATGRGVRALLAHPLLARGCEELVFDESDMFVANARDRLPEFRGAFRNISMIMDCVACEKCRLWGKLQFLGVGTALRVLFTENDQHELKRNEVIALVNLLHKLLSSAVWVDELTQQLEVRSRMYALLGKLVGVALLLTACVCIGGRSKAGSPRGRAPHGRSAKPKPPARGGARGASDDAVNGARAPQPALRRRTATAD
jgi:ERO1-like protein alpha